jgi:hypothetical protein
LWALTEQDAAVGLARDLAEELPLGQGVVGVAHVGRDVLDRDAAAEPLLHPLDAARDVAYHLLGAGQGQQIVELRAADAGPAQMVGYPGRLHALHQRSQGVQVGGVQGIRRSDAE